MFKENIIFLKISFSEYFPERFTKLKKKKFLMEFFQFLKFHFATEFSKYGRIYRYNIFVKFETVIFYDDYNSAS